MEKRLELLPIYRIWNETYWGELGLITFDSTAFPGLVLLTYIDWAERNNHNVVIIDVLDAFKEYTSKLSLLGVNSERYSDVKVIKIAGRYNVGNIITKIPTIDEAEVERKLSPLLDVQYSRKTATAVIGISKVFALYSERESLSLVDYILGFVGDKRRKAFYFVNLDILKNAPSIVLPMLTGICTTVVNVKKEPKKQRINVVKALNFDLEDLKAEANLKDVVRLLTDSPEKILDGERK